MISSIILSKINFSLNNEEKTSLTNVNTEEKNEVKLNENPSGISNLLSLFETVPPPSSGISSKNLFDGIFKHPIQYLEPNKIHVLNSSVSNDLELNTHPHPDGKGSGSVENTGGINNKSMYEYLFQPTHLFGHQMMEEWGKNYTTDINYLRETQNIILQTNQFNTFANTMEEPDTKVNDLIKIYKSIKNENIYDKYGYMDWKILSSLNYSPAFLQYISVSNLASPVGSFLIPVIMAIIPFVLLKIQGIPIQFHTYIAVLRDIAKNHFIGKLLNIQTLTIDKIVYAFMTVGFYVLQMYNNIRFCHSFYNNIQKVNNELYDIKHFIEHSIHNMNTFVSICENKTKRGGSSISYSKFCNVLNNHLITLSKIKNELENIKNRGCNPIYNITQLGYLLKCYYELHSNEEYDKCMRYSFGFEGYINNLLGVSKNIENQNIHPAVFVNDIDFHNTTKNKSSKSSIMKIENQYYPPHQSIKHIKNSCSLNSNMIITGVNASGKTTLLKTTTINIIFSQQIGFGFYYSAVIVPYTHIHSYINIPDTSGRDSLFQAEARRCKEILDIISTSGKESRHFCIFDELYSGTNPVEASKSAYAFLLYLSQQSNVEFMLTTHYTSICKKLAYITSPPPVAGRCFRRGGEKPGVKRGDGLASGFRRIKNYRMGAKEDEKTGNISYTYKLERGICKIQGAIDILRKMEYPSEIIENYLAFR